jgi:hypothetical protein
MEQATAASQTQQSLNDLSNACLKQLAQYLGGNIHDYESLRDGNTRLSHVSEKLRMATSHVFDGLQECFERLSASSAVNFSEAPEAFIWMEFAEHLVDVDSVHDARYAFPIAFDPSRALKCSVKFCCADRGEGLVQCANASACYTSSAAVNFRGPWNCPNYFHLSCFNKLLLKKKSSKDKKRAPCCQSCLASSQLKSRKFLAAKFVQAADVKAPAVKFCEIYACINSRSGDDCYKITAVKPGLFPFLSFGRHLQDHGPSDWRTLDYWIEQSRTRAADAAGVGRSTSDAASRCVLVEKELPNGKMWSFSGCIQSLRCARAGVLTPDMLRTAGVGEEHATSFARILMETMRFSQLRCPPQPEKWKLVCAKKLECWTLALAQNNGDVVVASATLPLSSAASDAHNSPVLPTRTLTVTKDDSKTCAAQRVAWNCDGTLLAASSSDHRVLTWHKLHDIDVFAADDLSSKSIPKLRSRTCEWSGDAPIVSLMWSPVHPQLLLVATSRSCVVMRYHPRSADSVASISADEVFSCPHGITCATFGSNGVFIAAGTESSGWFAIDLNSRQHFSKIVPNLPPGCCAHSILSICALPVLKSGSAGIADVMDGRDFAVASRFASGSIIHIWKFSEFKLKYEVVKELQLDGEANSTVTSLICSRDSFEDPDSFKILALDGSSTGHLISYLGGHCYGPCIEPVNFHCPMHHKPVNVTRAAWSTMARAVCFCDFSTGASKEVGGFWWGLPRLCDIRRSGGGTPVSNPWQTNHREKFGQAFTCDLSVHSYIREVQAGEELDEDLQCVEGVWNHDVVVHQQVVSDVADRWKELAKATRMRPDVVDRVVQQIAVTPPLPPSVFLIQFDVFLIHFHVFLIQFDVFLIQFDVFLIPFRCVFDSVC